MIFNIQIIKKEVISKLIMKITFHLIVTVLTKSLSSLWNTVGMPALLYTVYESVFTDNRNISTSNIFSIGHIDIVTTVTTISDLSSILLTFHENKTACLSMYN